VTKAEREARNAYIRELAAAGWTQARIAAEAGLSTSAVGYVLSPDRERAWYERNREARLPQMRAYTRAWRERKRAS
jgi:hypothetical protein